MTEVVKLMAGQLTGWDFLVAGLIVLFTEYVVKNIFKDNATIWKIAPIVAGAIVYVVMALFQSTPWYTGLLHGIGVGTTAMGSYDIILKTIKEHGVAAAKSTNKAIEEAIGSNKK